MREGYSLGVSGFLRNNIYESANIYVVTRGKESEYITKEQVEESIQPLLQHISPTDEDRFKEFIDFSTVKERLKAANMIEDSFYSVENGYFTALFIAVPEGNDDEYIFFIRDINEDKARERTLERYTELVEMSSMC